MNKSRKIILFNPTTEKIKYYIFCIRWLWKHREWQNTRQKFKAMERDYMKEGAE